MELLITFAALLGMIAGALHLYHHYVTKPAEKRARDHADGIRSQLSDLRIQLIKMNREISKVSDYGIEMPKGGNRYGDDDALANDGDEDDNKPADKYESEDIERLKLGAERRRTMVESDPEVRRRGLRSLLKTSKVAKGFEGFPDEG